MKIGDLSIHQSGLHLSSDAPAEETMDVDPDFKLPISEENGYASVLSKNEERALTRESTAASAGEFLLDALVSHPPSLLSDWVTSLFRRVLSLYENLPEESGKTYFGGSQETKVVKYIRDMLEMICSHLSDQLFDIVLKLVYEYGTTNAKSNSMRPFGWLVACLARAKPKKTIDKFLPFCISQIEDELRHGASSIRTTASHTPVPSDTTLHWSQ